MAYDYLEYDKDTQSAKILYSTRGIDINIKNNDPRGITFYNNYYLTDYTKSLIKTGVVSFEPDKDLIEKEVNNYKQLKTTSEEKFFYDDWSSDIGRIQKYTTPTRSSYHYR